MADNFRLHEVLLDSPAQNAYLVSPNDNVDLPMVSRAIMVNANGTVKMDFNNDTNAPVTMTLTAGTVYPFRVKRIWANGTSATGIHALY